MGEKGRKDAKQEKEALEKRGRSKRKIKMNTEARR